MNSFMFHEKRLVLYRNKVLKNKILLHLNAFVNY